MKFTRSVFVAFTIWVLTALLNTVMGGSCLLFFSNEPEYGPEAFLLVFIFTLVFSIPGIFIFWMVLLANRNATFLFRSLLQSGFIISGLSSLLLYTLPASVVNGRQVLLSLCIVIAAITSIMIHHVRIKPVSPNIKTENHV